MMVTEKASFIGTSNWEEDYYTTTAGVTFVLEPVKKLVKQTSHPDLRQQMEQIFIRDYNSPLTRHLPEA
jgi:phospholipase D3/4